MHPLPDRSGPHDIGGLGGGPIARDERDDARWETAADASRMLLADAKRPFFTTDETRSLQERLAALVSRDSMIGVARAREAAGEDAS